MRRRGQLFFLLGVFSFAALIASIFKLVLARRLKCFLNFFQLGFLSSKHMRVAGFRKRDHFTDFFIRHFLQSIIILGHICVIFYNPQSFQDKFLEPCFESSLAARNSKTLCYNSSAFTEHQHRVQIPRRPPPNFSYFVTNVVRLTRLFQRGKYLATALLFYSNHYP